MRPESVAFALSGTLFGLLVGWMLGTQQAKPVVQPPAAAQAAPAPAAVAVDQQRVSQLEQQAAAQPSDAAVRTSLGNLYFDAKQYPAAAKWYEASLKVSPRDADVSTDLAVSYYYNNDVDRALTQIDTSLAIDPKHVKTLLNQGIMRAFAKGDLAGAAESWEKVVAIAPDSEEGQRARQGLEGLKSGHKDTPAAPAAGPGGGKD